MKEIICSACGKKTPNKYGELCSKCYYIKYYPTKKDYYSHYYTSDLPNPYKSNFKQVNVITSKTKICVVCNKEFKTQGRVNSGKTCSLKCREIHYQIYFNTPEKKRQRKAYHLSHLKERQNYIKKVRDSNPCFKLAHNLRSNLRINLLKYYGSKKVSSFEKLVGYSYADLKLHLEKQFTPEMSWSNFGSFWEVDHIVPVSWFKTEEQLIKRGYCLSNLQPLEKVLNCSKQDKFVGCPVSRGVVFLLD